MDLGPRFGRGMGRVTTGRMGTSEAPFACSVRLRAPIKGMWRIGGIWFLSAVLRSAVISQMERQFPVPFPAYNSFQTLNPNWDVYVRL